MSHGGTGTQPAGTVIGAAGGTVVGPNGARVVIPAGAVATNTLIKIEQTATGSPALPGGFSAVGPDVRLYPARHHVHRPGDDHLPFDPATVPSGRCRRFQDQCADQWEQVANATFSANSVSAQVTSFS